MTASIITRLEEAAEGSRELDLLVWASYGFLGTLGEKMGHVTTSIDAALALAERVLPGWAWGVASDKAGFGSVLSPTQRPDAPGAVDAYAATPALALCIAILKANHKDKP